MKITAERKPLADTIAWVAQALPKSHHVPSLLGIRLRATGGELTLSAFDYDVAHEARVPVDIAADGECLVSGAFLRTIVAALPGSTLTLEVDGNALVIGAGRSTYRTQLLPLDAYPDLPAAPEVVGKVDADLLRDAVTSCMGSADDEHATEGLRGLRIEADGELNIVGLDGRLLIRRTLDWPGDDFALTVPGRALTAAAAGLSGVVAVGADEKLIGLSDAGRTVAIRTLSGSFARWRSVPRPADDDRFAVMVDRDELAEAVKRAALLTRTAKEAATVTLTIEPDSIEVTSADDGKGGSEVVDADGRGAEVIPFSPVLLGRALAAMDAGAIRLGVGARRSPDMGAFLTIRPAIDDDDREAVLAAKKGGEAR